MNDQPTRGLDDTDRAIIRELQADGRIPYARLAPRVGLSEAATRQRVNRLSRHGVMQVVAVTDPIAVGLGYQALIGIDVVGDAASVADELARITAVDYVVISAGRYDIVAEIVCRDADEFLYLLDEKIRKISGVQSTETLVYLRLVKQTYDWGTGE